MKHDNDAHGDDDNDDVVEIKSTGNGISSNRHIGMKKIMKKNNKHLLMHMLHKCIQHATCHRRHINMLLQALFISAEKIKEETFFIKN